MQLQPGTAVTCRVTRISNRELRCDILLHHTPDNTIVNVAQYGCVGLTRHADTQVQSTAELQPIHALYSVNDIIYATVQYYNTVSHLYVLSTQAADTGSVLCYSECGAPMVPVSSDTVQCPVTKVQRKCKLADIMQLSNNRLPVQ